MNAIPSGVEAALVEAGFSITEVAILRRLVIENALTLREIAGRSGKSTGVLDQAMKKLLQKNIVRKEVINDTAKYIMTSWDSVLRWMEEDDRRKRELMARRHQNFETFLRTIEQDRKRPEIEYVEGIANFPTAYRKLLGAGKELLCYEPVFCSIDDHPLRDFMVEWFRIRHKKGVYSRVITHNTPLGRRYQSRDPFEYRKTALIEEKEYPFTFEKIISGDLVACFNYVEKQACLLRYPELAAMEKAMFDALWRQATAEKPAPAAAVPPGQLPPSLALPAAKAVPLNVRTLSQLREFFLSRQSVAAFMTIIVLSAGITFGLYQYTKHLQFERMRETVKSIAATGALQFDAKDLDALRVEKDWRKPEWGRVVKMMEAIRRQSEDIQFTYMFRRTPYNPEQLVFIADSHSLYPYANTDADPSNNVDVDHNGVIDDVDVLQWPGQPYPPPNAEVFLSYEGPIATEDFYKDAWGKYVTGYAPIQRADGAVAGVIAVDMKAKILEERVTSVFKPILWFIGLIVLFMFIRLATFNKSLFVELWKGLQMKKVLILLSVCSAIAFVITFLLYQYMLRQTINEIGTRIMSIVATAAPNFDPKDIEQLHVADDMKKEAYQRIFIMLNQMRDSNPELKYAYVIRSVGKDRPLEFVADADSNYYLAHIGPDFNGDGKLDTADENLAPGVLVKGEGGRMREGFLRPTYESQFYTDQWGTWLSGYAPIKNKGEKYAFVGADVDIADVYLNLHMKFVPWLWFCAILSTSLVAYLILTKKKIGDDIRKGQ